MATGHDKLPNPPSLNKFPFRLFLRLLATGDVRATTEQRESFRRFAHLGDPLADDVVTMMRRLPSGFSGPSCLSCPNPPTSKSKQSFNLWPKSVAIYTIWCG